MNKELDLDKMGDMLDLILDDIYDRISNAKYDAVIHTVVKKNLTEEEEDYLHGVVENFNFNLEVDNGDNNE